MGDLFLWIGIILLFLGLPAAIVLTIIAFAKKWRLIFKLLVPITINVIIFFLLFGAILSPVTEVATQEPTQIEQQEEKKENNKETDDKPKKEKEEKPTKKEEPKQETPKENDKKEETPRKELTEKEYKKACKKYNYKDVLRNPEKYVGKKIVITLEISTVKEEGLFNPTKYYFAYSEMEPGSGFFWGDEYAVFDKRDNPDDLKILDGDVVKVWGEISEPRDTISYITNSEEVFCIDMKYVKLLDE